MTACATRAILAVSAVIALRRRSGSSVTVVSALFISLVFYRTLTWRHLLHAALETLKTTSAILIIVSAAAILGFILAVEQFPQTVARQLLSLNTDPLVLLLIVNVLLLIVGMLLDSTTATILIMPIIAGPLHMAGVDPVHLGIVAIFNLMLGLPTPPIGLGLFLISDIAGVSMRAILRQLVPYYIPLFATLIILTLFPEISLWLPKMLR